MKDIFYLAKKLLPYVKGAEGNVSQRQSDGFVIKASGIGFDELSAETICKVCDDSGNYYNSKSLKPSMETSFHSWLYKNLECNFIAHTHPTNAVKILCTEHSYKFASKRLFPDQVIYNGYTSCLVPYAMPGIELTNAIAKAVEEFIERESCPPKLILLKNHGIITLGKTAKECIIGTEICEKSAKIFTNESRFLNENDIIKLLNNNNEKYRESLCQE